MDQWVTNEMLALLICWAVGTIMGKLERQPDTRKDSATAQQPTSILNKLAGAQATRNEDEALVEAFRIVAQERMKGTRNGRQ